VRCCHCQMMKPCWFSSVNRLACLSHTHR